MTNATVFEGRLASASLAEGWLARARKALADRVLYSRTLAELHGLNDRDLRDLGISRHDIARIAREAVYGA